MMEPDVLVREKYGSIRSYVAARYKDVRLRGNYPPIWRRPNGYRSYATGRRRARSKNGARGKADRAGSETRRSSGESRSGSRWCSRSAKTHPARLCLGRQWQQSSSPDHGNEERPFHMLSLAGIQSTDSVNLGRGLFL